MKTKMQVIMIFVNFSLILRNFFLGGGGGGRLEC